MDSAEYIKRLEEHIEALHKVIENNKCFINRECIISGDEEFFRYSIGGRYYAHAKKVGNNRYDLSIMDGTFLVWVDNIPERKETISHVTFENMEEILKESLVGNADIVEIRDIVKNE